MVVSALRIDMDHAVVIDKINYSNEVTLHRFFEKTGAFFNALVMPGEKAEGRPEVPEDLTHIIPKF